MKANGEYLEEIYERHKEVATAKEKDEFYQIKFRKNKINPLKMVATFILTIGVTVGIAYAANVNIRNSNEEKKIWKEPKVYEFNHEAPISEEEAKKCISEEEAKEFAEKALKKIGLEEDSILNIQLEKAFFSNENEWNIATNKATILLEGETGELKSVQVPTWNYRIPYNYGITREEARKVAHELLAKLKPEDDKDEYELVKLTRNMETDEGSYIWYAQFQKKYGELINPYEEIYIGWVPTINGIYSFNIKKEKYEKNPERIGKEKAIEIAKRKEQQIEPDKTIEKIEAEIRIKQMNEDVYLREKYKEQYDNHEFLKYGTTQYETEKRVRKVWCVVIEHDENEKYTYFVDCTTGEIIGGNGWSDFENEKIIKEDPYNFAQ